MFCIHCGKQIADFATLCPFCGNKVSGGNPSTPQISETTRAEKSEAPEVTHIVAAKRVSVRRVSKSSVAPAKEILPEAPREPEKASVKPAPPIEVPPEETKAPTIMPIKTTPPVEAAPIAPAPPKAVPARPTAPKAPAPVKKKKGKKIFMISAAVVAILVGVFVAIGLFVNNKKIPDPTFYFDLESEGMLVENEQNNEHTFVCNMTYEETVQLYTYTQLLYDDYKYVVTNVEKGEDSYKYKLVNISNTEDCDIKVTYYYNGDGLYIVFDKNVEFANKGVHFTAVGTEPAQATNLHTVYEDLVLRDSPAEQEQSEPEESAAENDREISVSLPFVWAYSAAGFDFTGVTKDHKSRYTITFKTDKAVPGDEIDGFIEALVEEGCTVDFSRQIDGEDKWEWYVYHPNMGDKPINSYLSSTAQMEVRLTVYGGGSTVTVKTPEGVTMLGYERHYDEARINGESYPEEKTPEPSEPEVSAPESDPSYTSSSDPSILPNFLKYDSNGRFEHYWSIKQVKFYKSGKYNLSYTSKHQEDIAVVEEYIDALKAMGYTVEVAPDSIPNSSDEDMEFIWILYHPNVSAKAVKTESKGQVELYGTMDSRGFKFTVITRKGIAVEGYEDQYASYDEYTLPDFLKYDSTGNFVHSEAVYQAYSKTHCKFTSDNNKDAIAVMDYIDALCDMGYMIDIAPKKTVEEALQGNWTLWTSLDWYLYNPDVDAVAVSEKSEAQVLVTCHIAEDSCYIDIIASNNALTMENYEDEYSVSGIVKVDDTHSDDDDDDDGYEVPEADYNVRSKCGYCNNGDCRTCGGYGYLYSSASGKRDRNCTGAYCNFGSCSRCNGDGWMD